MRHAVRHPQRLQSDCNQLHPPAWQTMLLYRLAKPGLEQECPIHCCPCSPAVKHHLRPRPTGTLCAVLLVVAAKHIIHVLRQLHICTAGGPRQCLGRQSQCHILRRRAKRRLQAGRCLALHLALRLGILSAHKLERCPASRANAALRSQQHWPAEDPGQTEVSLGHQHTVVH